MAAGTENRIGWIHGLRGLASWIVVLSHFRLSFWQWSTDASTDGNIHLIQWPYVGLVCAGRPAVRVLFVLSGVVLSNSTAKHIQAERPTVALVCLLRGIKTRYLRLMLPTMCISVLSVTLLWTNAYALTERAPGYLATGVMKSEGFGITTDYWFAIWGSLVEVWLWGWQPAHSSLWCLKPIILGSYMLYMCWLVHGGQPRPLYVHWAVSVLLLLSTEAAAFDITDCAGTIMGGIVAYHLAAKTKIHPGFGVMGLVLGLFLASYPIGEPNATWCHGMFNIACKLMRLNEYSRHEDAARAFWYNIAAFLIVMSIAQLEQMKALLSAHWLQATGTISFALFLVHPIVFWTVGAAAYLTIMGNVPGPPSLVEPLAQAAMLAISAVVSWFAAMYWHRHVELTSYQVVTGWMMDQKEAWTLA